MKSLTVAIASIVGGFILIYFLIPVDVYYQPTSLYALLLRAIDFLNQNLSFFPSRVVFILNQQRFVGFVRYLNLSVTLFALLIPAYIFRERINKLTTVLILFVNPLIYLEIFFHLGRHDIDTMLLSPFYVVGLIVWIILFKRKLREFIILTFLAILFLTFIWWIPMVENLIYNQWFLFPVPLGVLEYMNILIAVLIGWLVFRPVIFRRGSWKGLVWITIGYIFIATIYQPAKFGKWIWVSENKNDQYVVLEKELFLPTIFSREAKAKITAKSSYKLYINGQFIGNGPGPNDERRRWFDEYNLEGRFRPGENRISIIAYNYGHPTHFQKEQPGGVWGNFQFYAGPIPLVLPLDKTWLVTDETNWRMVNLKTTGIKDFEINSGIYHEEYDFGKNPSHFVLATEKLAVVSDNLIPRELPLLVNQEIKPIKVVDGEQGREIEMGEMLAGYPNWHFQAKEGGAIRVKYIEDPRTDLVQWDDYFLPGKGEYFVETFGRRGFREVQVTSLSGNKLPEMTLVVRAVRFGTKESGSFESNRPELVSDWEIGARTLKYALQDQYEDSFIWERSQYLGDSYLDMLSGFYSLPSPALARKALYQFASSQRANGVMETVYPSGLNQTITSYNLMFASFLRDYFLYTEDIATVKDLLPAAERILEGIETIRSENELVASQNLNKLNYTGELIGWIDHTASDQDGINLDISLSSLAYKELIALAYLDSFVNEAKSKEYGQKAWEMREKVISYINETKAETLDPHSAILLINSGMLDSSQEREIYQKYLISPRPFITAYFDTFYLLALEKMGDLDGINRVLDEQWGGMARAGMISTPDVFDPLGKMRTYSYSHAWSSGATYFLSAYGAGILPLEPGFKKILIHPNLLSSETASHLETPCGQVDVGWKRQSGSFELELNSNCNSVVRYELPFTVTEVSGVTINGQSIKPGYEKNRLVVESKDKPMKIKVTTVN